MAQQYLTCDWPLGLTYGGWTSGCLWQAATLVLHSMVPARTKIYWGVHLQGAQANASAQVEVFEASCRALRLHY